MGLGFRIGSARPVILKHDSSVLDGSNWKAYAEALFDESHLVLDPSDPPVRFMVRGLTDTQKDLAAMQPTTRARAKLYVRCGLLSHAGYQVQKTNGETVPVPLPDKEAAGDLGTVITERWMKTLGIDGYEGGLRADVLVGLFEAIEILSEATLPLSKRSGPGSGPPVATSKESAPSPSVAQETATSAATMECAAGSGAG